MRTEVYVKEYIQVAHRLTVLPGKCENIHGHSMLVIIKIGVEVGNEGVAIDGEDGSMLDFGEIKHFVRKHLNDNYDHHLLLNENDSLAQPLTHLKYTRLENREMYCLPGLVTKPGDPTVENMAKWIFEEIRDIYDFPVIEVEVQETATNGVIYRGN